MKTFRYILSLLAVLALTACDNDGDMITTAGPDAITLSGSGDAKLSGDTPNALALTLYWNDNGTLKTSDPQVLAPKNAAVNTLQFSATDDFASTIDEVTDAGITSRQYTHDALNSLAGRLGLPGDVASPVYIRVRSVIANNIEPAYSNVLTVNVTPYVIDMTKGYILNSDKSDAGTYLYSPASDGVYRGFMGAAAWYNYFLQEGNGITWGNDGDTGTPFAISSADNKWNFWFPGQTGCYYTTVDTKKLEWSALFIPALTVKGDIAGDMVYDRKQNKWTLTFDAKKAGNATIQISGNGSLYNLSTGTDDSNAIATPVAFSQSGDAITFGQTAGNISVSIPATGTVTLTLDLSDPANLKCSVEAGTVTPTETPKYLYMSGIDDGISGSWTFDNYLCLYNEDDLAYAGVCNVNSQWGYKFYTEKDNWDSAYGMASGDAAAGTLVKGGDNVPAPAAGLTLITASINKLTYTTTAVSKVAVTGINDDWTLTEMTATSTPGTYTADVAVTKSTPWGIKIIVNDNWDTYFGGKDGSLVYVADNIPFDDALIGSTATVTVDLCKGTYTITKK